MFSEKEDVSSLRTEVMLIQNKVKVFYGSQPSCVHQLLGQKGGLHESHAVQDNRDGVSDDDANNNGSNHITEHLGILGVDNLSLLNPLRVIQVICSKSKSNS